MRIQKIVINQLFGVFNYEIPMSLDEGISFIHGINGCGKTTIFKILDAYFNKRISEFNSLPFESLAIAYDDGTFQECTPRKFEEPKELKVYFAKASPFVFNKNVASRTQAEIELFEKIINSRFALTNKKVEFKSSHFEITAGDKPIPPASLSFGEEKLICLMYELLFAAYNNSLILIDTPETSLHVSWQKDWLSDVKAIASLKNLDLIIATHSPDIIQDQWNLTVELNPNA